MNHKFSILLAFYLLSWPTYAQEYQDTKIRLDEGLSYRIQMQGSVSDNRTPLWLNANHNGLSSLEKNNGYFRAAVERKLTTDSLHKWGLGYALDIAGAYHYTSKSIIQQAYIEGRWLKGVLTIGAKEWPMEMKNNRLSSGSQTLGINARPVPQIRLALDQWWNVFKIRWLALKGHVSYGMLTDGNWEEDFTSAKTKYGKKVLYHSKAGYIRLGNPDSFAPLSAELGLEMASLFGGTLYIPQRGGGLREIKGNTGLSAFKDALIPGGSDATDGNYKNVEGDQLGSWVGRINYDAETWKFGFYFDKFFEDHSGMFQVDYDGFGSGSEWDAMKKRRYLLYDFKDWMLGLEINMKYGTWIRDIVFEYLYTEYQSGPIYHDHNKGVSDHIGGRDNYYNHNIYAGWQHWGQAIGNPLYTSPIYNKDGRLYFTNTRFKALHLGVSGSPLCNLHYRFMATYQEGLGTYDEPYTKKRHNVSFMAEASYEFLKNWTITANYGMDFGSILGHNKGFQITVTKFGWLNTKKQR